MKKIIPLVLIATVILLFTSCLKENHKIRFQNNFSQTINNIVAGSAHIGTVGAGSTSGYFSINTGNFSISGSTPAGQQLTGSGSITGKGTHKWTLVLSGSGTLSLSLDK